MFRTSLVIIMCLLSIGCAAKDTEARRVEHVCIFHEVEKICKDRDGVKWLKITERENELDLATVKCYDNEKKEYRFTCLPR